MYTANNAHLTAKQVTYIEEDVLKYDTAGMSALMLVKLRYRHSALGDMEVKVGWIYKFLLKGVDKVLLITALEAYPSARKYVTFLRI